MKAKIIIYIFLLLNLSLFSQSNLRESWSIGAGLSNFMMNGDLKAKNSLFNLGGYLYADKMISPSFGFEVKLAYSKLSGQGNDNNYSVYNTSLDNTNFKGTAIEGETNVIYNLNTIFNKIHSNKSRKFNFSALLGIGIHRYNSILYKSITNEVLADFGNSPSKNGTTTSFYYTTGVNVKYRFNNNIDFELRQNFNINEDDHLDAVISNKSNQDYYFKTSLGIVFNFNKKEHKNFIWYDNTEINIVEKTNLEDVSDEADDDLDGVINRYDIQKNTPNNAIVYGNGVAIDSDQDGIIDLYDKCPLEYANTKTGCLKDVDTDHDGVIDSEDNCPTLYGKTTNGCPKEKEVVAKITPKALTKPIEKGPLTEEEKFKQQIIKEVNKKNTAHGNYELDNSVNINDVDSSPVYPDCIDKITKFDRTNCIISSISKYVNQYYNTNVADSIKGKVRVLFIVKEDGSTKVIDILGDYNIESKKELKRVLETLPNIAPGTYKGIPVPVKYSLLFILQ